jgi:hypothetical protein
VRSAVVAEAVLVRGGASLLDAASRAADEAGVNRHTWLVAVIEAACREAGTLRSDLPDADDVPLPGVG